MLTIVSATRHDERGFRRGSALGRSLARLAFRPGIAMRIAYENAGPLAFPYNAAIVDAAPEDALVFVHDDVWIEDWFLADRIEDALRAYDVAGIVGNRRRLPRQPSWAFAEGAGKWDRANLSGAIGFVQDHRDHVGLYGPAPAEVKLLDGLFLAARAGTLREAGVEFDPRFAFHAYDLDFCRACERAGLRMGTWPIAVLHESGGAMGSPEWHQAFEAYLAKWGE